MNATKIDIRAGTAEDFALIRPLWDSLYEHQQLHGLLTELASDGFDRWTTAMTPVLDRFACLIIAEVDGVAIGFLAGRVRSPTPPFAPAPVGFISEVFVTTSHRGSGAGRLLIDTAFDWFRKQGVTRIELQVLSENALAREAYRRLGWREELVQMVYYLNDSVLDPS